MSKPAILASAVAATLGATTPAHATQYNAALLNVASFSNNGSSAGNITSSTASWQYDDVTQLLTQTGGTYNVRFNVSPTATLFRHSITGLVIGNSGTATAATYACAEGNFGGSVGASICGNYSFGGNFTSDSTSSWGPGTASARTIGGDDAAIGQQQSVAGYDAFTTSLVGTTLLLSNAVCTPAGNGCTNPNQGGFNSGYRWTLSTQAPTTADDGPIAVTEGVAEIIPVGANDTNFTDPSSIDIVTQPTKGTITEISLPGPPAGMTITYTANIGAVGADSFVYRLTDASPASDTATVTLNVSPVADTIPAAFSFTDQTNVALSTLITSEAITIAGINVPTTITIVGGTYSIDAGAFTAVDGTVSVGQTVIVRQVSSANPATATNTAVTIGGVSETFTVTTRSAGGGSGALDGLSLLALCLIGWLRPRASTLPGSRRVSAARRASV